MQLDLGSGVSPCSYKISMGRGATIFLRIAKIETNSQLSIGGRQSKIGRTQLEKKIEKGNGSKPLSYRNQSWAPWGLVVLERAGAGNVEM